MKRVITLAAVIGTVLLSPQAALAAWAPGAGGTGAASARSVGVPTAVTATATGDTSVHVAWAAPGGGSVAPTGYVVTRTAPSSAAVCTVGAGTLSCDDVALSSGTTYSYTVTALVASNWTSGASAPASATTTTPGPFVVTVSGGTKTAGAAFSVTIRATTNGFTTDTGYTGVKAITFSGPGTSPSGTDPSYPATVTFTAGIGTATVTLYDAASTSITAVDGSRSGSKNVTVAAGTASQLRYSSSTPDCSSGFVTVGGNRRFTSRVSQYDAYLNPKTQSGSSRSVHLSAAPNIGSFNRTTLTISSGSSQSSQNFRYTMPNGTPPDVTVTAASSGLTSAVCVTHKN